MSRLSGVSEWALLLAPEPPFPMTGGGAVRTASLCRFLQEYFPVHLVSFAVGEGRPAQDGAGRTDWVELPVHRKTGAARAFRNGRRLLRGTPPLTDRFCGAASRAQAARLLEGRRYRVAVLEHFWCAPYLDVVRRHADHVVLDLHNVESVLHARCAASDPWPERWAHRRFAAITGRRERELLPRFDLVLTASETDRGFVQQITPGCRVAVYPNAVPWRPAPQAGEEHCLGFSGNLEYHPNVTAVQYFAREIWPELRRRDPELRWRLIGKNEGAIRRRIAGDARIEMTGPVEDALAELGRVKVVVAPLLSGSGTRVKILEAWLAGRAVVSTRLGAEGLPATAGENILLADTPAEMRNAIIALLEDEGRRRQLGQAGRATVERELCWPAAWRRLEQSLAAVLPARPAAAQARNL